MAKKKSSKTPKFIFVVGGVISGVGKGIASASIGHLLQAKGFKITALKIDPYINVDAGTMNPTEHGEVFVLDDGYETDQDMGSYERFLNKTLSSANYMTTGRVYLSVIEKERQLAYGGKCVEVIPHIPLEVVGRIKKAQEDADADITIVEIGGTVGEYQILPFLEAARMMKLTTPEDVAFVIVSYLPIPSKLGEMKTKPTQYAIRTLNSTGIHPNIVIARSSMPLDQRRKETIALNCNIPIERIISAPDVDSVYDVPLNFEKDELSTALINTLHLKDRKSDLSPWSAFVKKIKKNTTTIKIAVVGKYFDTGDFTLADSYLSVIEALKFSSAHVGVKSELTWINAKEFETNPKLLKSLSQFDGIVVPGGFGTRGVEGKIAAINYARLNKIPYFGLCYGMQLMVIEHTRNVAGIKNAHTTEVDPKTSDPIITVISDQIEKLQKMHYGGSMRLGGYNAVLKEGSIAYKAYGKKVIRERHRHRLEVNPEYVERLEESGLVFSGVSPDGTLMEIAELPKSVHPFFLGTQFHPEFLARPLDPHPLFTEFIKAAKNFSTRRKSK